MKNPYLLVVVCWLVAMCFNVAMVVLCALNSDLVLCFVNLAMVCIDGVFCGIGLCNYTSYRNFLKSIEKMRNDLGVFENMAKSLVDKKEVKDPFEGDEK